MKPRGNHCSSQEDSSWWLSVISRPHLYHITILGSLGLDSRLQVGPFSTAPHNFRVPQVKGRKLFGVSILEDPVNVSFYQIGAGIVSHPFLNHRFLRGLLNLDHVGVAHLWFSFLLLCLGLPSLLDLPYFTLA